jgi:hypothetical protein
MVSGYLTQYTIQKFYKQLTINNLQLTINIHCVAINQNWHGFRQTPYWKPA